VAQTGEIVAFIRAAYTGLGKTAKAMGELEAARDYFEANLQSAKDNGSELGMAWSLLDLANVELSQGAYETPVAWPLCILIVGISFFLTFLD
jgi:hypothetical protein